MEELRSKPGRVSAFNYIATLLDFGRKRMDLFAVAVRCIAI